MNYLKQIKFPEDFIVTVHPLYPLMNHLYKYQHKDRIITVITGRCCMSTEYKPFEMWDSLQENPIGYMTKADINKYLSKHLIQV